MWTPGRTVSSATGDRPALCPVQGDRPASGRIRLDRGPRTYQEAAESDDEGTGSVDDLADEDADRLLPDAIEVIREYDRA
jgi:hypothetical protein